MHGERRDPWFLTFAPPQQWGRCRDRRFTPSRDEAVRDRRFVQCIKSRGPLDLEARRLGARLAARPRWCCLEALEGGPAPGGAGAQRLRRDDLGVHGVCGGQPCWSAQICGWQAPCYVLLPPPVGLPPQRDRGSHECRGTNPRRLAARLIDGAIRATTFGARRSMQRWWLAAPRPARASTATGPGGGGWPEY